MEHNRVQITFDNSTGRANAANLVCLVESYRYEIHGFFCKIEIKDGLKIRRNLH